MAKKKAAKKQAKPKAKAAAKKKATVKSKPAGKKGKLQPVDDAAAIGRVLVTQEEKLYMLFKEDYHARQIFEFLRVETVKDLERNADRRWLRFRANSRRRTKLTATRFSARSTISRIDRKG